MIDTLAIVGVGLLGGSIALAAKAKKAVRRIIGISRDQQAIEYARTQGMIDIGFLQGEEDLSQAELAILCIPVDQLASNACALLNRYPNLIVSDVGSTKTAILQAVQSSGPVASRFVGAHPLAGSEKSGPEHASASLFQNRLLFLCPLPESAQEAKQLVSGFWQKVGCTIVEMDSERHDAIMAVTSHLPHLLSHVLASAVPADYLQYCGTGMKTMTRLAGSEPDLWTAIAMSNRHNLLQALHKFQAGVMDLEQALHAGNEPRLHQLLSQGKRTHHALGS